MIFNDKQKDFDITQVKGKAYAEMKEAHYHPYYEFYYLLSGTRKLFINDTIYSVKRGDLVIIPKGEIHRTTYISGDTHERIAMIFSDSFISRLVEQIGEDEFKKCMTNRLLTIPANRREYVEELFGKIIHEHNGVDSYSHYMLRLYIEELLVFVLRFCASTEREKTTAPIGDDIISDAAHFISANFAQNLSLNQLAGKYAMSPSYFSRKFKLCTGFGYKEYLNTIRIMEASKLLLKTNLSITEIAQQCGFEDSNYFGDSFKKAKGISPRDYRKTNGII